jgi:hypothetical protein
MVDLPHAIWQGVSVPRGYVLPKGRPPQQTLIGDT